MSESPALLELGPLMGHTNPQQFRFHRAVQSPSGRPTAPSRHVQIARSRSIARSRRYHCSRLLSHIKTNDLCLRRCSFPHARPPTCSPAPQCHVEFRTRARWGVLPGSIPIAVCDVGPLVGLFVPTSQRKSHFRPPSPLGNVKDWSRCDPTTRNSHSRPQSLFLVKRWFVFVQCPKFLSVTLPYFLHWGCFLH